MAWDFRSRIGMADANYTSNAQYPIGPANPIENLLKPVSSKSLVEIAIKVRQAVSQVTAGAVATFVKAVNLQPTCYIR
ncbi:hypothetical protein EC988_007175, partial [Linderina pennispora]